MRHEDLEQLDAPYHQDLITESWFPLWRVIHHRRLPGLCFVEGGPSEAQKAPSLVFKALLRTPSINK